MKKYILELTERQYDIIALCTEVVHRIASGQVEELDQIVPKKIDREVLMEIKEQAFPELLPNQNYKWCGGHQNMAFCYFQAATYAIYREMLHVRAVHEGEDNVYRSQTLRCDGVDLPNITIIENEQ
jgi:hypothetical protein